MKTTEIIIKIEEAVCRLYQCHPRSLYIKRGNLKNADPRRLCFLLCHSEARMSFARIAARYGPRTKQSTHKLIQSGYGLVEADKSFKQKYFAAINMLYSRQPKKLTQKNQLQLAYENQMSV